MLLKMAFMLSVPMYSAVAWLICRQPAATTTDLPLPLLFQGLVAVYAVAVLFIEPMITRATLKTQSYNQGTMLVKLAIYESGALYGLVLTFLSHDIHYLMVFAVPSMVLMALTPVGGPVGRG